MVLPGDYIVDNEDSPVEIDAVVEYLEHSPVGVYVHTTMGEKFPLAWCEKEENSFGVERMIRVGDKVVSNNSSGKWFEGIVEEVYVDFDGLWVHLNTGLTVNEDECQLVKSDYSSETEENNKDSCDENIGITDLIEAAPKYNGHTQLVLERIRLSQIRPLMRELEKEYCTKGGHGINAVICEDGSGALECENYWPDGNCLGHTSRTLIGWNELEGW